MLQTRIALHYNWMQASALRYADATFMHAAPIPNPFTMLVPPQEEGVQATTRIAPTSTSSSGNGNSNGNGHGASKGNGSSAPAIGGGSLDSTLICFVLVDPQSRHAFCSRYDFGPWPLLDGISELPERAQAVRGPRGGRDGVIGWVPTRHPRRWQWRGSWTLVAARASHVCVCGGGGQRRVPTSRAGSPAAPVAIAAAACRTDRSSVHALPCAAAPPAAVAGAALLSRHLHQRLHL